MSVWILIFMMSSARSGHTLFSVDNIVSAAECERLKTQITAPYETMFRDIKVGFSDAGHCYEVKKVGVK